MNFRIMLFAAAVCAPLLSGFSSAHEMHREAVRSRDMFAHAKPANFDHFAVNNKWECKAFLTKGTFTFNEFTLKFEESFDGKLLNTKRYANIVRTIQADPERGWWGEGGNFIAGYKNVMFRVQDDGSLVFEINAHYHWPRSCDRPESLVIPGNVATQYGFCALKGA